MARLEQPRRKHEPVALEKNVEDGTCGGLDDAGADQEGATATTPLM